MSSNVALAGSSLRVIVGPTAAGKSALALALAERFGATIISADSRQIYTGFDIGTAKPSLRELARVPHEGIDVALPSERWSAARYADAAATWIDTATALGRVPVVAGGTGFWIGALVAPLAPMPELDAARRADLDVVLRGMSGEALKAWCARLDPAIAVRGHAQWRRAIEMALLSGRRLSEWQRAAPEHNPRAVRYLLVDPGTSLDARISARVDAMFAAGWIDEVRALSAVVAPEAVAWKACGYERVRASLTLEASGGSGVSVKDDAPALGLAAMADAVRRETRQYARRQRTWFRRQLLHGPVTPLDPGAPDAWAQACAWWEREQ
jgi:tRNA dimethylallyltransferase